MKWKQILQIILVPIMLMSLVLPAPVLAHDDHEHASELEVWIARIGFLLIVGTGIYVIRTAPREQKKRELQCEDKSNTADTENL